MKTGTLPYRRVENRGKNYKEAKGKGFLDLLLSKENMIILPVAFLLGRADFAGGLMPFGTAFFASVFSSGLNRLLISVFVLIGTASSGGIEQICIAAASMVLFYIINVSFKKIRFNTDFRCAVISLFTVLIPEIIIVYLQGFLVYDLLRSLLKAVLVFALVFVFRRVTPLIGNPKKISVPSIEDKISMAIMAALALSGLGGISILGVELRNILSVLTVLLFSYRNGVGVGAAAGVTIGLIVSMSTSSAPIVIGSYALCGVLAGALRKLGRVGASLGFVMGNMILTVYLSGSAEVLVYLKEIVFAIGIFIVIPNKAIYVIINYFDPSFLKREDRKSYSTRIKEITIDKLNNFSRAFRELAKTFDEISQTGISSDKQEISFMFDRVADRVCKDCSLCLHCWDRNFYSTYQVMFKIIEKLETKGRIEVEDIPRYFMDRCERINYFIDAVNNIYELFKVDIVWQNKIGESRGLVSQQLDGMSKVIDNLAWEIDSDIHFITNYENLIINALDKQGVKVSDVVVYENSNRKIEAIVSYTESGIRRSRVNTIERIATEILGKKMVKQDWERCKKNDNSCCSIKLLEQEKFSVTTGVAKVSKYDGIVSGDNYTFMNKGDGKYIVALSDGMGSGQKAAAQSRAAISLLEQFMESGFDKDTAIKLINSILVLKSNDDSFATIDMSVIDLYNGDVEFIKIGAVPTFIKRPDRVENVKSVSLPAGILNNIEMELISKKVESGDLIVMMTDGVIDSFQSEECDESADRFLSKVIDGIKSINPQDVADRILDKAYENYGGKPADDMMVLAAKVWKRAGV